MPSPDDMMSALDASMRERTGHTTPEWVAIVKRDSGVDPLDQKAVRAWLRDAHGIPQNSQWAIAFAVAKDAGWVEPDVTGYTDALYSGKKAGLRPLHDLVLVLATSVGEKASAQGRSTYIPVVHGSQFAAIAPGPRQTLRVGLRLRDVPADLDGRFEPAKNFAQATHWVHLPADTTPTPDSVEWLRPYLRLAYDQNA